MRPIALVLAALSLAPTVALAQSNVPEDVGERPAAYKPVEEHDFDGVNVDATAVRPGLVLSTERVPAPHATFIVLRANFNPEMDASAAEIR